MSVAVSAERKQALVNADVTLNGERARISGASLDFPTVAYADGPNQGAGFEWAWETVDHIVTHKAGVFTS